MLNKEVSGVNVAILAIGNEVLSGKTINTNSAFIAKQIEQLGGKVTHQQVVPDNEDEIVRGLQTAYEYAEMVITIGGLGPTVDDLSRDGVARYFKTELVFDEGIYEGICDYFKRSKKNIPFNNQRQAFRFKEGLVLPNHNGTAPGLFLSQDNQSVFLLPGPPAELELMFLESVKPYLVEKIGERKISKSYRLCGIGESYAEEMILHLYDRYPHLNIAPYCAPDKVDYIVSTMDGYESELENFDQEFKELMKDYYIGNQETDLAEVIVTLLQEKRLKIATAESSTGGLLSSALVNVSGASSVFLEGVVTYSYESKLNRLNIDKKRLMEFGAVSEEIASDMAVNLAKLTGADITIGITEIAGPNGGSETKPVGLVYIAIYVCGQIHLKSYIFNGNREKIRQRTVAEGLYWLHYYIKAL